MVGLLKVPVSFSAEVFSYPHGKWAQCEPCLNNSCVLTNILAGKNEFFLFKTSCVCLTTYKTELATDLCSFLCTLIA